jgi:hypothetical protein
MDPRVVLWGGWSKKWPHTNPQKRIPNTNGISHAWRPLTGSADDGKRNEMEMDVALGAGGQKGGGLGEGGLIVSLGPRVGGFFLRL